MKVIHVQSLNGVSQENKSVLFQSMKTCSNGQRLAVTLYMMSDLPAARHHLGDIEKNLKQIFPPALRKDRLPDDYVDFQASTIRFYFNSEKRAVKLGKLKPADRLWINLARGYWRNTHLGNEYALQVLRQQGILIEYKGSVINAQDKVLSEVERDYLEEEIAEDARTSAEADLVEQDDGRDTPENLLAYIDKVLSDLPLLDLSKIPDSNGILLTAEGSPDKVQKIIRSIMDQILIGNVVVEVRISKEGITAKVSAQ